MSAIEPLYRLVGVIPSRLTDEQRLLLEADIFTRIYEELREVFRKQHKDYFFLMKFTTEMENIMLESKFVCLIVQDILSTGDYNLEGIAHYTDTHEEIVEEMMIGRNSSPSAAFFRKLINLHRSVKPEVYEEIMKKLLKVI